MAAAVVAPAGPEQPVPQPVPPPVSSGPGHDDVSDLRAAVDAHEKAIIEHHLARNRFNQRQTAKALGLTYDQLRHCLRKHGLTEKA